LRWSGFSERVPAGDARGLKIQLRPRRKQVERKKDYTPQERKKHGDHDDETKKAKTCRCRTGL
jgi:hypothetical protein